MLERSIIGENISGLTIDGVKTLVPNDKPTIELTNVQDLFLYNCNVSAPTPVFLSLRGEKTKNIVLKNNNLSQAIKALSKDTSVQENVVID